MDWPMAAVIVGVVVNLCGVAWLLRDALAKEREETARKIKASEAEMKADFVCKNVCKVLHEVDERDKDRLEKKIDSILVKLDRWFEEKKGVSLGVRVRKGRALYLLGCDSRPKPKVDLRKEVH